MIRVLITGAGGPAAISLIREYLGAGIEVFAADLSDTASGLYLVPESRRVLLPAGDSDHFQTALLRIVKSITPDVLIPTVDCELLPCANLKKELLALGTELLLAGPSALTVCLDKFQLLKRLKSVVPVGRFERLTGNFDAGDWNFPLVVKPRSGSGGRDVRIVSTAEEMPRSFQDELLLVQEYLPGEEYSVDVLADSDGRVVACVPRERIRQDSGVAVVARTLHSQDLEECARAVVEELALGFVSNVQFRRDTSGTPVLMEVNPRFPGTMPITVASGVNMPDLALRHSLGEKLPDHIAFQDIEMIRYLEAEFLEVGTLASTQLRAKTAPWAEGNEDRASYSRDISVEDKRPSVATL